MIEVATASINTFGSTSPKADFVPPSEEPVFILTSSQLQDLIMRAVQEAAAPLEARIQDLEEERGVGAGEGGEDPQDEERSLPDATRSHISTFQIVHSLRAENHALKSELEALQESTARERAFDRQRIAKLEHGETARAPAPGTKTEARIAAIKEVLKTRRSTTFKELERILGISPREMLRLTKKLDMRQYEIFRRQGDAREKVIKLRAQISN